MGNTILGGGDIKMSLRVIRLNQIGVVSIHAMNLNSNRMRYRWSYPVCIRRKNLKVQWKNWIKDDKINNTKTKICNLPLLWLGAGLIEDIDGTLLQSNMSVLPESRWCVLVAIICLHVFIFTNIMYMWYKLQIYIKLSKDACCLFLKVNFQSGVSS
jgi:hypothetical protein